MKEFFTSSSELLKQKQMIGGDNEFSIWGGTQGLDSHFTDNIPSHTTDHSYNLCYSNMDSQHSTDYHPTWSNKYCHQYGGLFNSNNKEYMLYKKYKSKYKSMYNKSGHSK